MNETNMVDGGDHFYKKPKPLWVASCGVGWFACCKWSELRNDKRKQFCPKCGHRLFYSPAYAKREDNDE